AVDGDRNLGGFDFDNEVIEWARGQFHERTGVTLEGDVVLADLRDRVEQAKHRLSTVEQAPIYVSHEGGNEKLVLTRERFEEITRSLLVRTEYLMENALEAAGLTAAQVDRALLVGGS